VSSEWDFDWAPSEQVRSEAVIEEPEAEDLEPKEAIADAEGDQVPVGEDGALQGTEDDAPAQNDEGDDNGAAKAVATPTISSRSTRSTSSRAAKPASAAPSSTSDELDDILDMPSPAPKDEWEDENFEDELDLDDDILDAKPPTRRPEPEPKKSISTVPIEVIDVMLRNNMEVKRCFGYYAQAHGGKLPARIDVKFTLQTSGRASSLTIKQAEHNKTDIEQCLRTAIGSITFPPSGKSQKLTYPFILQ
jgi:hypothetical protein